jgi:hypothetical protein
MLELDAKSGDFKKVKAGNEDFIKAAEALIEDLRNLLAASESQRAEKRRLPAPDRTLMAEMLEAVRHFSTSDMEKIQEKLEMYEYDTGGDLVAWLRERLDNLEYDAISRRLKDEAGDVYLP